MNEADDQLKLRLADIFLQQDQAFWSDRFAMVDACVESVLAMDEALVHPHNEARQLTVENPSGTKQIKPTPFLEGMSSVSVPAAPLCGQDNQSVLQGLGFSPEKIAALEASGLFT